MIDLLVHLVLEEKAIGVVVNHLKVGAGVGRGHLCPPVVVAVEKRRSKELLGQISFSGFKKSECNAGL